MNYIDVNVTSCMAICQKAYPVSSNEDYTLRFHFDNKWKKERHKKARLVFDGKYIDIPIKNALAKVGKIPPCESLNIGVYSKHFATTLGEIGCVLSCLDRKYEKGEYFV